MRHILIGIALTFVLGVSAQTFNEVADGQVDVGKTMMMNKSCTVTVQSFALSDPISISQYQAYMDYFLAISDSNTFALGHVDIRTLVLNGESPKTYVSWTSALAYCDWLAGRPENRGWRFRLPLLSEWILAREAGVIGEPGVRIWLMNAKDESLLNCEDFDSLYDTKPGDPFALRRKMAVHDSDTYSIFGTGENYWQDMSYPNVGFCVVRYQ